MKVLPLMAAFVFVAAGAATITDSPASLKGCAYDPSLMQRGTRLAAAAGTAVHDLNGPVPTDKIKATIDGTFHTIGYWWGTFGAAVQGRTAPETPPQPCPGGTMPGCGVPADPSVAAAPGPVGQLTGPDLAADALRRAGFPADEIPTFVAIAEHESGFNPEAWNNYGAGMAGMFQLNQAYWKMDNWKDPYANAVMAKKVRDESVAKGQSPWYPWSTWRSAVRDAGKYARFGQADPNFAKVMTPAAVQATTTDPPAGGIPLEPMTGTPITPPECVNPNVTVASWNVAHWNSGGNVVAGVRTLTTKAGSIGLQEVDDSDRGRIEKMLPAGWRVTDGMSSTPVIWDGNRYTYLGQEQKVILNRTRVELGSDGYTIPQKTMNTVQLVDRSSGVRFAHVNFHLPPSTGSDGGKDAPEKPKRLAAYRLEKSRVITKVQELRAQGFSVSATCDCNRQDDLDGSFGTAGLVSSGGALGDVLLTHSNRTLDFILAAGMTPSSQQVLPSPGSDHDMLLATFVADEAPAQSGSQAAINVGGDPSGRTTMDGKTISRIAAAQILLAERESGIDFKVMQGGFGGSHYGPSGTSHNYPGVVDVSPGTVEAETALRRAGFAAWARNIPGRSYVGSGEHIHGVSLLDPADAKHPQVTGSWARGENGLDGGKDPAPHWPFYPSLSALSQTAGK